MTGRYTSFKEALVVIVSTTTMLLRTLKPSLRSLRSFGQQTMGIMDHSSSAWLGTVQAHTDHQMAEEEVTVGVYDLSQREAGMITPILTKLANF